MASQIYYLTPAKPTLNDTPLGFVAQTVIVNNYTNQYVNLPDAGTLVPPFTFGVFLPLPAGLTSARANLIASPPATGPVPPTTQTVLTWTDAPLQASSGTGAVTPYTEINAVRLTSAAITPPTAVIPVADTSIFNAGEAIGLQGVFFVIQSVQLNTSITVTPQNTVTFSVPAGTPIVRIPLVGIFAQPIQVTFGNGTLGNVNASPWQAPNQPPLEFESQLNAGATTTLIAAPGGDSLIFLHSMQAWILSQKAGAKYNWLDSNSGSSVAHIAENGILTPSNWDFKGAPLSSSSSALQLHNGGSGNADFIIGTICYSTG